MKNWKATGPDDATAEELKLMLDDANAGREILHHFYGNVLEI